MDHVLTTSNVGYVIGIMGMVLTVYKSIRNPQIKSDKIEAVMDLKLKSLGDMVVNLRDNHMHTMDLKMDQLQKDQGEMKIAINTLATIINERIPAKK